MFSRHESELFKDAFHFLQTCMSTGLLKIQSLHDSIKTFIIYQICVFVMVNCSLMRLKLHLQKCDVNFQKSLCHFSEIRLTRIFLQIKKDVH